MQVRYVGFLSLNIWDPSWMIFRSVAAQKSNPIFSSPVSAEVEWWWETWEKSGWAGKIVTSDSHTTHHPTECSGAWNQSMLNIMTDFQDAAPFTSDQHEDCRFSKRSLFGAAFWCIIHTNYCILQIQNKPAQKAIDVPLIHTIMHLYMHLTYRYHKNLSIYGTDIAWSF